MPSKVNLITPPDVIHNKNFSLNFININEKEKETISIFLGKQEDNREINIFHYLNDNNPNWLLNVVNRKNSTFVNLDNCGDITLYYTSYILSLENVFYFTEDNNKAETYSLINVNRVSDIQEFLDKVYNEQ